MPGYILYCSSRLQQVKVLNIFKESLSGTISYIGNAADIRHGRIGCRGHRISGRLHKMRAALAALLAVVMVMMPMVPSYAALTGENVPLIDNRKLEGWPSQLAPEVDCVSAYAIEASSGTVVFSKAGDRSMHPASITKVMTALVVIENCNLDEMVTFESQDVDHLESGGNNYAIKWKGETLSVKDCLYALMLESVNECGMALARHVAGSVSAFCDKMNKRAIEMGCTGTYFTNPHGLNDEAHVTTARDMVIIFRECLKNETFYEIASTLRYKIAGTALNPNGLSCYNHDRMMRPDSEHYDEHVVAGKTGYTSICGNTLLTFAEKDGMQLVICLLKGSSAANNYRDTKKVMKYATENFVISDMGPIANTFAKGLVTRAGLRLGADGNGKLFVPKSYEGNMHLYYYPSPDAPNYVDGWVGTIYYRINGQTISTMRVMDMGPATGEPEDETTVEATTTVEETTGQDIGQSGAGSANEGSSEPESGTVEMTGSEAVEETSKASLAGSIDVTRDASAGQGQDADTDKKTPSAGSQDSKDDKPGIPSWVRKVLLAMLILILLFAVFVLERYIRYRRRQRERRLRREERRRKQAEARKKQEERAAAEKALEEAILKAIAQSRQDGTVSGGEAGDSGATIGEGSVSGLANGGTGDGEGFVGDATVGGAIDGGSFNGDTTMGNIGTGKE